MRGPMRPTAVVLCLLGTLLLARTASPEDPPAPPKPPAPKPAEPKPPEPKPLRLPAAPVIPGIHWEADFEAGLRRAAKDGRPVFFAINAMEDQPGGEFTSAAYGVASRAFVCFVGNDKDHATTALPDGTRVCSRYKTGTCKAHQDALAHVLARLSTDGSLISPSHFVLDPDGQVVWQGDYVQSTPAPGDLDGFAVRISPRVATRGVWAAREERTTVLDKTPAESLAKAAGEWLGSSDALAPAGVVALLDQESDEKKRAALFTALATAGPRAVPLVFDAVDDATSKEDATDQARWIETALALDDAFGGWALARAVLREKGTHWADVARGKAALSPTAPAVPLEGRSDAARGRVAEALLLRKPDPAVARLLEAAQGSGVSKARIARALRRAGLSPAADLAAVLRSGTRDERRDALRAADAAAVRASKAAVEAAFDDSATPEEVRVAAAIALRRAGDGRGTKTLLGALADPVEGPEARAALVEIAGRDVGEDPAAWEEFLRGDAGGGK
jgi:hypothetical protein